MTSSLTHIRMQQLRRASIFATTSANVLTALADRVEEVRLAADQQLFAKGDHDTALFLVISGLLRVHIGDQTVVELSDGEVVGELAALDQQPRSASVSAIEPTTLYRIERRTLQSLMADHPEIANGIIQELAHRLRETSAPHEHFS